MMKPNNQRADHAADIEAARDDAEGASYCAGWRGSAHQHVAGGHDEAAEQPGAAHSADQWRCTEPERPDRQHDAGIEAITDGRDLHVAAGHVRN
jgi:hypothetical protein